MGEKKSHESCRIFYAVVLELRKAGHRNAMYRSTSRVKSDGPKALRSLL